MRAIIFGIVVLLGCALCTAQQVYLFGTGIPERDAALADALRAHGLQVMLGVPYQAFDGSQNLSPFQVAVLAGSGYQDDMPLAGQQVLLDWVASGRGLVTLEWSIWAVESWNRFLILRSPGILLPAQALGGVPRQAQRASERHPPWDIEPVRSIRPTPTRTIARTLARATKPATPGWCKQGHGSQRNYTLSQEENDERQTATNGALCRN
jgi:hypothetical protein